MTVRDAIHIFQISQKNLHRKRTTESYRYLLEHLENHFTDSHIEVITPDQIYQFLEALTEHAAIYASRNGIPLEVVSKVLLRHQDLKTTQMYLGENHRYGSNKMDGCAAR